MKGKPQSKPSKASLIARGLATKPKTVPVKGKTTGHQKKKTVPDSKPGYALYSTDSEADQVPYIKQGLDRCANLLSNILDSEPSGVVKSKVRGKKAVSLAQAKKVNVVSRGKSQPRGSVPHGAVPQVAVPQDGVAPGAIPHDAVPYEAMPQTSVLHGGVSQVTQPSASRALLVIPTGKIRHEEATPSPPRPGVVSVPSGSLPTARPATVFNERVTASTPVLNAEQRKKQHELMRREQELQQQLLHLKQHYELLQQQQSPQNQENQKRILQQDMLHQLNNSHIETSESNTQSPSSCTNEARTVLNSGTQLLSESQRPTARRSLDYAVTTPSLRQTRGDFLAQTGEKKFEIPTHDFDPPVKKVKQVRIVSPASDNVQLQFQEPPACSNKLQGLTPGSSSQLASSTAAASAPSHPMYLKSSPMSRPRSAPPRPDQNVAHPTENQIRTLLYLVGELRSLLGSTGDVEVDRLMTEVEHTASLLPLMVDQQLQHYTEPIDVDLALQPLRLENSQLRRKLRIANQKLQDQENAQKNISGKQELNSEVAFEMAACKSVNKVLQDQLRDEKESKEKILRINESLSKSVSDLQEEKRNLLQLLSEKDQDYLESKRGWQQETSKACIGTKQMHAELRAAELASEAVKKENKILNFALKQKDKEIERLKELTRSSQQSLTKLLSNMQQFQPNGAVDGKGFLHGKATALGKLEKLLSIEDNSRKAPIAAMVNGVADDFTKRRESTENRTKKAIRFASPEVKDMYSSRGGSGTSHVSFTGSPFSPTRNSIDERNANLSNISDDLSSVSSKEEKEFKQDLANLDANIARLQRNLHEALSRN